ncbi:MAG: hypothetical protein HN348_22060 [Proteobacteria bacterium]|jgi:hypothetical protein|nr:hypothetical protein [Pseudomonadota bacterium]
MATFDHIILNGRPGGGKSEVIDFLKQVPKDERMERFHIGAFDEHDDFPWLWEKFIEDDLWERLGEKRLFSHRVPDGYVQNEGDSLLDMLILKLSHLVEREYLAKPDFYEDNTLFLEFSRGTVDGGYRRAYELISKEILKQSAILYISVTYEESQRRNEARYQEKLAHSILAHKLPNAAQERFSAKQDFHDLAEGRESGYLDISGIAVPFVAMNNQPELKEYDALNVRYTAAFQELFLLYSSRPT